MTKENNNGLINILRFISCLFVVFIHVGNRSNFLNNYIIFLGRFAVLCFFMISGYYTYNNDNNVCLIKLKKQIKKILIIILSLTILYFVFNCLKCLYWNHNLLSWLLISLDSYDEWFNLIIYNRAYFVSSIMWYLLAIIYVYVIYYFLVKIDKYKYAYYLIIPLIIVSIIFSEIFKYDWYITGNFIFTGIPFFLIGNYFHYKNISMKKPNNIIIFIILSFILSIIEFIVFGECFSSLSISLLAILLFLICLLFTYNINDKLSDYLRKYSSYIFYFHCMLRDILYIVFDKYNMKINTFTLYFFVLLLSLFISYFFDKIKRIIN